MKKFALRKVSLLRGGAGKEPSPDYLVITGCWVYVSESTDKERQIAKFRGLRDCFKEACLGKKTCAEKRRHRRQKGKVKLTWAFGGVGSLSHQHIFPIQTIRNTGGDGRTWRNSSKGEDAAKEQRKDDLEAA